MRNFLFAAFVWTWVCFGIQCFPVPVTPAQARDTICTTTCHTDSGGHLICRTRCR